MKKNLKIGIDAFPLSGRIAGIGRYVLEICLALDALMPDADFYLYSPFPLKVNPPSPRWTVRIGGGRVSRVASSYVWLKTVAGHMAKHDGVNVFWAPRTILPFPTRAFRTISTVHDLNYLVFPQSMPHVTFLAHWLWFARDVRRADAVATNSLGTADRLRRRFGVRTDVVAKPGVANAFKPIDPERVASRLSELGVSTPYFLAVGTVEPRKNLPALVKAFVSLKRSGELSEYELLIAGDQGWRGRKLHLLFKEAKKYSVRWLGFVPDDDLSVLYTGAKAFVQPSVYEGFGIPVAEARACGAQIIATDIPELREAGGNEGIYINTTVSAIRESLKKIVHGKFGHKSSKTSLLWLSAAEKMATEFRKMTG